MSRAYRISVKESLARHVEVEDGISSKLELLPLLSKERMRELLAAELVGKGFVREGHAVSRDEGKGVVTHIDLDTGEVDITAEGHADVSVESARVVVSDRQSVEREEAKVRSSLREGLERELSAEEEALRREVAAGLEARLKGLKPELDGVVNRVTATALKQRAAELGTVEEVKEDADGGLTIKVRV
jgi:hypothetical protein